MSKRGTYWRGVDVALEERQRARQAVLDTLQWAQTDRPLSRIQGQIHTLAEFDEEYLDLMVQDLLYDYIGTQETDLSRERKWAVQNSRQAWRSQSPLAQRIVDVWTSWGLGDSVQVAAEDETNGQPVLDEFWKADRNAVLLGQDRLSDLSERVLVDGNAFLTFFASTLDGLATVRVVKQDEIEIVTNPEDALTPWFYKRTMTSGAGTEQGPTELYYPDWALYCAGDDASVTADEAWAKLQDARVVPSVARRADQVRNGQIGSGEGPGTAVCMLHVAHNRKDLDSLWGWPLLTVALPWLRTHKRFAQARLTVAMSVAQFVRRSKVSGGSRAVASVIDTIASNLSQSQYTDTNPSAAAGSWHVENKAMDTTELPMRTGAQDAKSDNEMFAWLVAVGAGLDTVSIGLDANRWATAVQMDKVQSYLMNRYKSFWSAQFRRVARIVFSFAERYGSKTFSSTEVQVSVDTFSLPDFPGIVDAETGLMDTLTNAVAAGVIPANAAAAVQARMVETALQALGVRDAGKLTSDEAFECGEFAPEEEEEPEQPPPQVVQVVPQEPEEEEEAPETMEAVRAYVRQRLQEQREPFVPVGAADPVLPVPDDVEITDLDIERAMALWDSVMPELRGMLDTEDVIGQVYDGQY